jgi:hypothetical protein
MKIPKRIKVSSHTIKIRRLKKIKEPAMITSYGYADLANNEIVLCKEYNGKPLPESMQSEVLLHELLHVISALYGIPLVEGKVNQLAAILLQVIRFNKLNFLSEEL